MSDAASPESSPVAREEALLAEARSQGSGATLKAWVRLSGPGWLQSAITLGGGSLASALYLGVLTGTHFLWVQVFAMALGVIALGAISWVTLTTGENPFRTLREKVSPVLAWSWLVAVMMANIVWALPQFSLAAGVVEQNLLPEWKGTGLTVATCAIVLALALPVVLAYGRSSGGVRTVELVLRALVGAVVLAFFGVVIAIANQGGGLSFGSVLAGLVPDLSLLTEPAPAYAADLAAARFPELWEGLIVRTQQEVLIAAAATAVGINMTFLMPCSLLRRGWNRGFRGLAVFDLATGLLIPFVLATGCVVLASADRFHGQADQALVADIDAALAKGTYLERLDLAVAEGFAGDADGYARHTLKGASFQALTYPEKQERVGLVMNLVSEPDRRLAAMLEKRDAGALARALEPLTGSAISHVVFGLGVLAMAVSTVIVLMLISGLAFAEAARQKPGGRAFRWGAFAAGLGALGPFVWTGDARAWLAVPTSNIGMMLLPLAYWSFVLLLNSRRVMGDQRPAGRARLLWNAALVPTALVVTFASGWTVWMKLGALGLGLLGGLAVAILASLKR
jgi:Mn2+/Fe2+ NRAMP family transporter